MSDKKLHPKGSLISRFEKFKLNVNAIKRKKNVRYYFYATGTLSCVIGSLSAGVIAYTVIKAASDAERERIKENCHKKVHDKWIRSIYYLARIKGVNKTCQELAPFTLKTNEKSLSTYLIDSNDGVYQRCFPKDASLFLDQSCNQIFGSYSTYAACYTIFNNEGLNTTFLIGPERPSFFLNDGPIWGGFLLFCLACLCLFGFCILEDRNDCWIEQLPKKDIDLLYSSLNVINCPPDFRNLTCMRLSRLSEIVLILENTKEMKIEKNNQIKLTFLSQFYQRDKNNSALVKLYHCPPKPILQKILFFAGLMEKAPIEESSKNQGNLTFQTRVC